MAMPTIEIDDVDNDLSKSNAYSYTQVSSSSQNHINKNNQYARQTILNTIMLHLHSYTPPDTSKWNLYRDFDEKFSASICPTVYRNFERIIL
jgi:trehalose-6-phosphate synthase